MHSKACVRICHSFMVVLLVNILELREIHCFDICGATCPHQTYDIKFTGPHTISFYHYIYTLRRLDLQAFSRLSHDYASACPFRPRLLHPNAGPIEMKKALPGTAVRRTHRWESVSMLLSQNQDIQAK